MNNLHLQQFGDDQMIGYRVTEFPVHLIYNLNDIYNLQLNFKMNEAEMRELYLRSKQQLIKIILIKEKLLAENRRRFKIIDQERNNQRQQQQQYYKKIVVSVFNNQHKNSSSIKQQEDLKYEKNFIDISKKVDQIIKILFNHHFDQSFKDTIKCIDGMNFRKQTMTSEDKKHQKDDETVLKSKIFNINQFKFMNENIKQKNINLKIEELLARIQNQSYQKNVEKQLEYRKEEIQSLNKELKQAIRDKQKIKSILSQVEGLRYKETSLLKACLSTQEQNILAKLTSQQLVKKIGLLKIEINEITREKNEISSKLTKFCMQQKDRYNLLLIKLKNKKE